MTGFLPMSHILLSGLTAQNVVRRRARLIDVIFVERVGVLIGVAWGASARSRGVWAGGWVRVWRGRERQVDGRAARIANWEKILDGRGGVKLG